MAIALEKSTICVVCGHEIFFLDGYCKSCREWHLSQANIATKKQFHSGGQKDLTGKIALHLIPPEIEEAIVQTFEAGIKKGYEHHNWKKGLPLDEVIISAARRHINAWRKGKDINEESGLNHLKHALVNLAMAVYHIENGRIDLDDREKK